VLDADEVLQLGASIRSKRRALGLTLVRLAAQSGLSQPFLSQVERGEARPSMRSLAAIARALGTTAPALLSLPDSHPMLLLRQQDGFEVENTGGSARSLARGRRLLLPMEFIGGSREFQEYNQHEGDEILYVISGVVEVDLESTPLQTLRARDSLYYEATRAHRWRVVDAEQVWLLVVANQKH